MKETFVDADKRGTSPMNDAFALVEPPVDAPCEFLGINEARAFGKRKSCKKKTPIHDAQNLGDFVMVARIGGHDGLLSALILLDPSCAMQLIFYFRSKSPTWGLT